MSTISRDQVPHTPISCKEAIDQLDCLSGKELALVITELIGRRGSEIAEHLDASSIQSILLVDRYGNLPTPATDSATPIEQYAAESDTTFGHEPALKTDYRASPPTLTYTATVSQIPEPQIRSNSSPARSSPEVNKEAEQSGKTKRKADASDSAGIKKVKKNTDQSSYERAVAKATSAANEFWSTESLKKLWHLLRKERQLKDREPLRVSTSVPQYSGASKQDIITHLKKLQTDFMSVKHDSNLTSVLERYKHVLTVRHFDHCHNTTNTRESDIGSLYSLFPKALWSDWVEVRELGITKVKNPSTFKENRCRDYLAAHRGWVELDEKYGCAILSLLQLKNEHLRRLTNDDKEQLFSFISATHPNLKEDLKHLSELILHKVKTGNLPTWKLQMEAFDKVEDVFVKSPQDMRELLSLECAPAATDRRNANPDSDTLDYIGCGDYVIDNVECIAEAPVDPVALPYQFVRLEASEDGTLFSQYTLDSPLGYDVSPPDWPSLHRDLTVNEQPHDEKDIELPKATAVPSSESGETLGIAFDDCIDPALLYC